MQSPWRKRKCTVSRDRLHSDLVLDFLSNAFLGIADFLRNDKSSSEYMLLDGLAICLIYTKWPEHELCLKQYRAKKSFLLFLWKGKTGEIFGLWPQKTRLHSKARKTTA